MRPGARLCVFCVCVRAWLRYVISNATSVKGRGPFFSVGKTFTHDTRETKGRLPVFVCFCSSIVRFTSSHPASRDFPHRSDVPFVRSRAARPVFFPPARPRHFCPRRSKLIVIFVLLSFSSFFCCCPLVNRRVVGRSSSPWPSHRSIQGPCTKLFNGRSRRSSRPYSLSPPLTNFTRAHTARALRWRRLSRLYRPVATFPSSYLRIFAVPSRCSFDESAAEVPWTVVR